MTLRGESNRTRPADTWMAGDDAVVLDVYIILQLFVLCDLLNSLSHQRPKVSRLHRVIIHHDFSSSPFENTCVKWR